jgi:hypothetical protein
LDVWFSTNLTNINTINSFFGLDHLWIVLCWTWVIGMVSTPSNLLAWTKEHAMQLGDPLLLDNKSFGHNKHTWSHLQITNIKYDLCTLIEVSVVYMIWLLVIVSHWPTIMIGWGGLLLVVPKVFCCSGFSFMGGVAKE